MLMAGCLNQSKRIIQKFDDILYGSSPELLVVETHRAIKQLLQSEEARLFLCEAQESGEQAAPMYDRFIKRIVVAVSPIVPITLRDRSLDGTYLREALHMLGLFSDNEGLLVNNYLDDIWFLAETRDKNMLQMLIAEY